MHEVLSGPGCAQDDDLDRHTETYASAGFLSLQMLVDKYILNQRRPPSPTPADSSLEFAGAEKMVAALFPPDRVSQVAPGWNLSAVNSSYLAEPLMFTPQLVQLVPLPILGYHFSTFYVLIQFALALVFVLVYLDTKYTVVATFITEKETRM